VDWELRAKEVWGKGHRRSPHAVRCVRCLVAADPRNHVKTEGAHEQSKRTPKSLSSLRKR